MAAAAAADGDFSPQNDREKNVAIFAIVLGAFLYAYIIGNFSSMIDNLGQDKASRSEAEKTPPALFLPDKTPFG